MLYSFAGKLAHAESVATEQRFIKALIPPPTETTAADREAWADHTRYISKAKNNAKKAEVMWREKKPKF